MPSKPAPFVSKTFEIVNDPNTDHITSWSADGLSFIIHKSREFQKDILPVYFKHSNLCSFVRQLNTYGFRKVVEDSKYRTASSLEFKHPSFIRGNTKALRLVSRKKSGKRSRDDAFSPDPSDCSSPTDPKEIEDLLKGNKKMEKSIKELMQRQQETQEQINVILEELDQAKKLIKELEALPDAELPPLKRVKLEPESLSIQDPISEFWYDVDSSPELVQNEPMLDFSLDFSGYSNNGNEAPNETPCFDLKEFLFQGNVCVV